MKYLLLILAFITVGEVVAIAQPTITSFSPASGPIGTTVTITGTNFSSTAASNIVYFGAVKATVSAASATSLTVTVPSGATYQPITVTTNGLTAYAAKPFGVTFTGGGTLTANSLVPEVDSSTGATPLYIRMSDIDGDGKPDLIVHSHYNTAIFRNTSTITHISYAREVDFGITTTGVISGITVADIDGDGKPDVLLADNYANVVRILKNTSSPGSISFAAEQIVTAATGVYNIAVADVDGDGKPDMATVNFNANTLSIYKNTSTGSSISFAAKIDYATGNSPCSIAFCDLDGDGKPDIATANNTASSISILKNASTTGAISFGAKTDYATGGSPYNVVTGDIDGDGKPDLVVANNSSASVSILRNTTTTSTISLATKIDFATSSQPYNVSLEDLDGDGRPDLIVSGVDLVSLLKNNSVSSIVSFASKIEYGQLEGGYGNAVGDADGDGRPDVIATNDADNYIAIYRNRVTEPVITSFTPTHGGMGTTITITGVNFTGATAVSFGGTPATSFTVVNATTITAVVGSGATGTVSVTTPAGTGVLAGFLIGPTITSFAPTAPAPPGTTITITGINFIGVTAVTIGGVPAASFTVVSSTSITAVVKAGAQSGSITVVTPGGTATLAGYHAVPVIAAFSPTSAATGTTVTIIGTDFDGATAVSFGGVAATSWYVSPTNSATLTAVVGPGASGTVSITTAGGTGTLDGFTYLAIPTVTGFTPVSAVPGTTITITGTNFTGVTAVKFGGTPATSFTVVSPTSITAVLGAGSSGSISVTNSFGTGSLAGFTATAAPTITSFTPATGPINTTVTITGAAFTGATGVSFGGTPAASFTVTSGSAITAVVGTGATGSVKVTNPYGADSMAGFTFIPPPTITSFTPTTAITGQTVTITGTDFTGATAVKFGGTAATSFRVVNATTITAVVAAGATGDVSVTGPHGTATLSGFIYTHLPVINSFTPVNGTTGTSVTISGSYFTGASALKFGTNPAASFTVVSDSVITTVVGTVIEGTVAISVTTPPGTTSLTGFYTGPTISSFTPATGNIGTTVTITGTNFSPTAARDTVYFGAVRATVTAASTTSLTVTVPTGATYQPISVNSAGLTAYSQQPFVTTYPGGGAMNAYSFGTRIDSSLSIYPYGVAICDLDGDGKSDLLAVDSWSDYTSLTNYLSVYRNTGSRGVISFGPKTNYNLEIGATAVCTADLDGDGKPDVLATNQLNRTVCVFKNNSTPGNISLVVKPDLGNNAAINGLAPGDLDGDGKPDVMLATNEGLVVLKNLNTNGNFQFDYGTAYRVGAANDVAVGDIDGDGKPDVIFIFKNTNPAYITVWRNTSAYGTISFDTPVNFLEAATAPSTSGAITANPRNIAIGDLDGDGKIDVAVSNTGYDSVSVLRNTSTPGNVSFAHWISFRDGGGPIHTSISDIDGDGKPELVTANQDSNTISIHKNLSTPGNILFGPKIEYATGHNPEWVAIGDLDGDGSADIATANSSFYISPTAFTVSIFRNRVIDALPLNLLYFTGKPVAGQTLLQWQTSQEVNTDHFDVERSIDGSGFTAIGVIPAIVNGANIYSYTDVQPKEGTNYYRLKMVDKDGSYTYSNVVSVVFTAGNGGLTVYPNPVTNNSFTVDAGAEITTPVPYSIYAIDGKLVQEGLITSRRQTISFNNAAAGAYTLVLNNGKRVQLIKK